MYSFTDTDWFKKLFTSSREIPLELVTNIDCLNINQKQDVLLESMVNLHRVLSFSKLSSESFVDDPEQFWVDTILNIEDKSYYASMLLPYLRQVIEDNTEITFNPFISSFSSEDAVEMKDETLFLSLNEKFDTSQSKLLYRAIRLSQQINRLEQDFNVLIERKEFNEKCISVYSACAELIKLSSLCLLPK